MTTPPTRGPTGQIAPLLKGGPMAPETARTGSASTRTRPAEVAPTGTTTTASRITRASDSAPSNPNRTRDIAVRLAERGWSVFPAGTPSGGNHGHETGSRHGCPRCKAEKEPRPGWRWKQRNSSDPRVIEANWPDDGPNIGVVCLTSRIVVFDLDTLAHGGVLPEEWRLPGINDGADVFAHLLEQHGESWPSTFIDHTASGGLHIAFRAIPGRPIPNSASVVGPMIDVRGDGNKDGTPGGGYVLGPGSVVGGGRYEVIDDSDPVPMPKWLADLADPPRIVQKISRPASPARYHGGRPGSYAMAALTSELDRVLSATRGTRNDTLNRSAFSLGQLVGGGVLAQETAETALRDAADRIGLLGEEPLSTEKTIRSGIESGMRQPRGGAA